AAHRSSDQDYRKAAQKRTCPPFLPARAGTRRCRPRSRPVPVLRCNSPPSRSSVWRHRHCHVARCGSCLIIKYHSIVNGMLTHICFTAVSLGLRDFHTCQYETNITKTPHHYSEGYGNSDRVSFNFLGDSRRTLGKRKNGYPHIMCAPLLTKWNRSTRVLKSHYSARATNAAFGWGIRADKRLQIGCQSHFHEDTTPKM